MDNRNMDKSSPATEEGQVETAALTETGAPEVKDRRSARLIAADIAECALFCALMVAGAFIQIPFPMVPLTFQTVFSVLSGLLLGWKKGVIATTAYALLGLIGVPVFSSGGGLHYVTLPSFGYILGFIASAAVAGIDFNGKNKLWKKLLLALLAFLADYAVGIPYFIAVWQLKGYANLWTAVVTYNLLYMPKDAVLCALAGFLAYAVTPTLAKMRANRAKSQPRKPREKETHNGV